MAAPPAPSNYSPLTYSNQLRYAIEWFREFSPLQKSDFLPILVESFSMLRQYNGMPPVQPDEAPSEGGSHPNIFQCRVKLFLEWSHYWTHAQKWEFINAIRENDASFVETFLEQCPFEPQAPAEE